jgi:hypothetical protein
MSLIPEPRPDPSEPSTVSVGRSATGIDDAPFLGMSTSTIADWDGRTSDARRDTGIRGKFIASVSARLKGEPDKGDLQGQSNPGEHFRRLVVAVLGGAACRLAGQMVTRSTAAAIPAHRSRRRRSQPTGPGGGDPSPPVPAPEPDRADKLDHPAGVDKFGRPRQNTWDKWREDSRAGQVCRPADREEGCDNPRAVASAPVVSTTGCLHRLTLRPMTRSPGSLQRHGGDHRSAHDPPGRAAPPSHMATGQGAIWDLTCAHVRSGGECVARIVSRNGYGSSAVIMLSAMKRP